MSVPSQDNWRFPSLTLQLVRDLATDEWYIRTIELRLGAIRNVSTLADHEPIGQAFTSEFLTSLSTYLPTETGPAVISLPGTAIETETYLMRNLRILSQKTLAGSQYVIVRITEIVGEVYAFLNDEYRKPLSYASPILGWLDTASPKALAVTNQS